MLHLSVVVFVLALLVCSISQYNNCRCVSAASAPIAPPSRILAIKRYNFAADGDVSGGQSSVTEIVDTIVQKVVSIRGGKSGAVIEVKDVSDLDSILNDRKNKGKLIVIDFTATWCGPCKAIAPVYEQMSMDYKDEVRFLKVDVDEAADVAQRFSVMSMPTFIFIKDSEVVERFSGANVQKLSDTVNSFA